MATVKHVIIFADSSGHGWTETHYKAGGVSPDLGAHLTLLKDTICPARAALLGEDCAIVGIRVSYPRSKAVASQSDEPYYTGMPGVASADENLSLAIKFRDATSTRKKILHLRGFPDDVEHNGDYHPEPGNVLFNWQTRLDAYKTVLIQSAMGWLSKDPDTSAKGDVTNYVTNANGTITFTVGNAALPAAVWNKNVSIRFSGLNNRRSTLNRTLIGRVNEDGTTATTIYRVAAFTFQSEGRYNFRATDFTLYAAMFTPKVGRRPQGKPLGKSPGRAAARPLG